DDSRHDRVVHVVEALVDALPARSQTPAGSGPREAPDRAADRRQDGVARQARFEHSGRDRYERTDKRSQPAEEDSPLLPALEPALGPLEAGLVEMEPAPGAPEKGTPNGEADRPTQRRTGVGTDRARAG